MNRTPQPRLDEAIQNDSVSLTPDLTDPALYACGDPHAVCAELRRGRPVFRQRWPSGETIVSLMRHRDITAIYRDASAFSSVPGTLLTGGKPKRNPAAGRMLALTDPPRHTALRRLVADHFSPRAVAKLAPLIDSIARAVADRVVEERECDLVDAVAPLPLSVICEVLGVPRADQPQILALTKQAFGKVEPAAQSSAHQQILAYFYELGHERQRRPTSDVISTLAHGEVQHRRLDDDEVTLNCDNLVVGGAETTRHAAAGGVLAFAEHPEQWRTLGTDEESLHSAVEEILRWTTPATHILRTATASNVIGGEAIEAGDVIALWNLSANRDEKAFEAAEVFDVARRENPHVSLGAGPHFCIGASLARAELKALLRELRLRVSSFTVAAPPRRLWSHIIYGFEELRVQVR